MLGVLSASRTDTREGGRRGWVEETPRLTRLYYDLRNDKPRHCAGLSRFWAMVNRVDWSV